MKTHTQLPLQNLLGLKTRLSILACLALALLMPPTAQATDIGPDVYGYVATDTATYAFQDISGTGTKVLAGQDDSTTTVPIGFSFNFYGVNYTSAGLSPNGLLTFGGVNSQFGNVDLTSVAPGGDLPSVAVLWDDWVADPGAVYYQTLGTAGARQFIVQWNQVRSFSGTAANPVTFEAILYEANGSLEFQYADVDAGVVGRGFWRERDRGYPRHGRSIQWSPAAVEPELGRDRRWPGTTVSSHPEHRPG